MSVTCKIEQITPAMAKTMLNMNTGNFRHIDKARVRNYAREMRTNNWDMNGETIKFNRRLLLDGQHRLLAIIESKCTITMLVVRGIESDAMHIDRGKPRSIGQWLRHNKIKNAPAIAAMTRSAIVHTKGLWSKMSVGIDGVTDSECIAFAETHQETLQLAYKGPRVQGMSNSVLSTILFLGSENYDVTDNEFAGWFREGLATGTELTQTDPAFHFRNRLLQQQGGKRMTNFMIRMLATLAWNKTVEGGDCTSAGLRLRMSGPPKGRQPLPNKVLVAGEELSCGD